MRTRGKRHTHNSTTKRRRNPILREMDNPHPHIKHSMKCSPAVISKKVQHSCYTPHILMQIRDAYNDGHSSEEQIKTTDPIQIWKTLNERLVHCQKEDCWLHQIKDDSLRKRIDRYIFAPDKPPEWSNNPNAWLSNYDILNVLEQYEQAPEYKHFEFIGPTPIDFDELLPENGNKQCVYNDLCNFHLPSLLRKGKTKIGIVFNLDKHDQSGSHWVSLFIDAASRFLFYFDSAGSRCPARIMELVNRIKSQAIELGHPYRFYQNYPKTHQYNNTECGMYSLFFIITMLTSRTKYKNGLSIREKLDLFRKHRIPDKYIERYRHEYFNG